MAEKHHDEGDSNREYHPNSSDMFSGNFPEGLRVLVFDKDQKYLMELKKHLQEFQYEVTCCNDEEKAMYLLRNHRKRFDIAIIEVQQTDSDRLRLLSEIRSEIDIIIMSKDESLESVINWMSHGACDYLIKPLNPVDLRFLFKHAAKKIRGKMSVVAGNVEAKAAGDRSFSVNSTIKNPNKRKRTIFPDEQANQDDHDLDRDHASTSKKKRVVWDEQLHKKFVDAVDYLGADKAVPTKILEIMNVKHIARENVASHLQKYRQNKTKKEEMKQRLLTPQEGRMYVGKEVQDFYNGRNVQFPTHHINNIPQPSVQQHIRKPNNLRTHLMSPLGHHHDGVSIAVSGRNLVMTHQHNLHHQVSNFNAEESLGYNNFNEDEPTNWASFFTPNSEEVSLFHILNPVMVPTTPNDDHLSPSSILHSFPSSSHTHSAFLNQQEIGGFNYNNGYSVNNNKLI